MTSSGNQDPVQQLNRKGRDEVINSTNAKATAVVDPPQPMRGVLYCKKVWAPQMNVLWKRHYVHLQMENGGAITVFNTDKAAPAQGGNKSINKSTNGNKTTHGTTTATTSTGTTSTVSSPKAGNAKTLLTGRAQMTPARVGDEDENNETTAKVVNGPKNTSSSVEKIPPADSNTSTSSFQQHQQQNPATTTNSSSNSTTASAWSDVYAYLSPELPWVVRNLSSHKSAFLVEILLTSGDESSSKGNSIGSVSMDSIGKSSDSGSYRSACSVLDDTDTTASSKAFEIPTKESRYQHDLARRMMEELESAQEKGKKLRIYFRCPGGSRDKIMWLNAFAQLNRLAPGHMSTRTGLISTLRLSGLRSLVTGTSANREGIISNQHPGEAARDWHRGVSTTFFTRQSDDLDESESTYKIHNTDIDYSLPAHAHRHDPSKLVSSRCSNNKLYKVLPEHCYPQQRMTDEEMKREMLLPSEHFHDLRVPNCKYEEIGDLRIEVLECVGLPKLDKVSDTDPVVYLVCGPYAFCTDIIDNKTNPRWLRKTRRACIFPLHVGYARLYAAVFDDDGVNQEDDLAGRVVIDLARLRPRSTYDVTLPLRMSAHVYSRRRRGAIRLRFTLHWKSERKALLSYLPKQLKLPKRSMPQMEVTLPCTDAKGFRNIALTIHGLHLPGHFAFLRMRALTREIGLVRLYLMGETKKHLQHIRLWYHPFFSGFIFSAWMHCVYRNAFSLVPAYLFLYLFLWLARNYAKYCVDCAGRKGFVPPSWEELFAALFQDPKGNGRPCIEPLAFGHHSDIQFERRSTKLASARNSVSHDLGDYKARTHAPYGELFFRTLKLLADEHQGSNGDKDHLEFPYALGKDYPKFTVEESMVIYKRDRGHNINSSRSIGAAEQVITAHDNTESDGQGKKKTGRAFMNVLSRRLKSTEAFGSDLEGSDSDIEDDDLIIEEAEQNRVVDHDTVYPEQNVDVSGKAKTKVTDDLEEIKEKMHELTWNVVNDRVFEIRHANPVYFGDTTRKSLMRRRDVKAKLQQLLHVGPFSHSHNPVLSRIGLYIQPMIEVAGMFLCLSRAAFNILTWQDPMLSFWFSIGLLFVVIVLFLFPWRIFLFIVGIVLVGPQNYVLRVLREKGHLPPVPKKTTPPEATTKEDWATVPTDRRIFCAADREPGNGRREQPYTQLSPEEVHHIVIPSTPLMYQRFYDWPPEPQYARVVPE